MNEADTRRTYVLPKLKSAGWEDENITEQLVLMPGRIVTYLDGLYPRGHLRQAKVNALPTLCLSGRLQSASGGNCPAWMLLNPR